MTLYSMSWIDFDFSKFSIIFKKTQCTGWTMQSTFTLIASCGHCHFHYFIAKELCDFTQNCILFLRKRLLVDTVALRSRQWDFVRRMNGYRRILLSRNKLKVAAMNTYKYKITSPSTRWFIESTKNIPTFIHTCLSHSLSLSVSLAQFSLILWCCAVDP